MSSKAVMSSFCIMPGEGKGSGQSVVRAALQMECCKAGGTECLPRLADKIALVEP